MYMYMYMYMYMCMYRCFSEGLRAGGALPRRLPVRPAGPSELQALGGSYCY